MLEEHPSRVLVTSLGSLFLGIYTLVLGPVGGGVPQVGEGGRELPDQVVTAATVRIKNSELQRHLVVPIAEVLHAQGERVPGWVQRVLDHLGLVDVGHAGADGSRDHHERITLAKGILLVQVLGGEAEGGHLTIAGDLLRRDIAHPDPLVPDLGAQGAVELLLGSRYDRAKAALHPSQEVLVLELSLGMLVIGVPVVDFNPEWLILFETIVEGEIAGPFRVKGVA